MILAKTIIRFYFSRNFAFLRFALHRVEQRLYIFRGRLKNTFIMIIVNGNEVAQRCGICGKDSYICLSNEELDSLREYLSGDGYIQDLLPSLNRCEREFIKSGFCPRCQELIFGNGETERITY